MQKESLLSHSIGGNGASAELCLQNNIYYTKLRRVFQNKKQTDAYTRNMRKYGRVHAKYEKVIKHWK